MWGSVVKVCGKSKINREKGETPEGEQDVSHTPPDVVAGAELILLSRSDHFNCGKLY